MKFICENDIFLWLRFNAQATEEEVKQNAANESHL